MIRQRLFLPQPVAGDCSSTDPVSDDTTTDIYAPVLKQLIPMRKNGIVGSNVNMSMNNGSSRRESINNEKREYIDIPLPKSVLQLNNQKSHDANCARYNHYVSSKSNFLKTKMMESIECGCTRNNATKSERVGAVADEHQDVSSNR